MAVYDPFLGLPRVSSISPASGSSISGTLVTVTGDGFVGGDGYRCCYGLQLSPWREADVNVNPAVFVDESTLLCNSTSAYRASATVALWRDFATLTGTQLTGKAALAGSELLLAAEGSARFVTELPVQAMVCRFNSRAQGGGLRILSFAYAAPPHYTPPPNRQTDGVHVRFDLSSLPHAIEVKRTAPCPTPPPVSLHPAPLHPLVSHHLNLY